MNSVHPSFSFTHEVSDSNLHFLDISLSRQNNHIHTDIYHKPTDSRQYLHFHSNHPRHVKRNIPYTLASRIHRIVSDEGMRKCRLNELQNTLLSLKYPLKLINDAMNKCIRSSTQKNQPSLFQPVVFTYSKQNVHFFHNSLYPGPLNIGTSFMTQEYRFMKSTRQPPNLIRLLNTNFFFNTQKCNTSRCKTCPHLVELRKQVIIKNNIVVFNCNMTCVSTNVIYVINCLGCGHIYVGETSNELRQRITLHRQHINHPEYSFLYVSSHIRTCNKSFSIIPIFQLPTDSTYLRKKQESYFISILKPELNAFYPTHSNSTS